jgi:hypothetical protein
MNLIIKTFLSALLFVVCGTSLATNWVRVGKNQNDGSTFFIDFDSLEFQSSIVKYKLKTELPGPKQFQNYTYWSTISSYDSNCNDGTARSMSRMFFGQRSEPLGSDYTLLQPINLSEFPNGIHTLISDGLCQLNKLNVKQVNLSINQPWDIDLPFNSSNPAQTRLQTASKAIQKIGNYLIFPQNVSFSQPQPVGDLFYRDIVVITTYNCTTEQRSGDLLRINYDSDSNFAKPVSGGGSGKAATFTPFARAENTARFNAYCKSSSEGKDSNSLSNKKPATSAPQINKPTQAPPQNKPTPVKSDSLL